MTKPDLAMSRNQLAELTGKAPRTVKKRLEGLEHVRGEGRVRLYDPRAALPLIFLDGPERPDADLTRERARLAKEQADMHALRVAERRGELLPRSAVISTWKTMIVAAKDRLRGIPATAGEKLGLSKVQRVQLLRVIDDALRELAGDGLPRA